MAPAKKIWKHTFVLPCTLCMNQKKHSHIGTPSAYELENISYSAGEKGAPIVNLGNETKFNIGVKEDGHLALLEPEGSTDKNVGTPLPDKEGGENDRTVNLNVEHLSGELNMCHLFAGVKLEEITQTSKDNPHFSAFELVEECFRPQGYNHMAYSRYGIKPKDVRGPILSRDALQGMLQEKEKENIALHQHLDHKENARKNDINELEDQMRISPDLVIGNEQES
ncbi:hypothetical protein Cgig2_025003 [Carnegiea gigantea]|uniref:Uncharacterized protein n=1 Tax=Carnegiea gigantea TaxID=171969 RepID=A0A9Q1Q5P0_9CARY|nr:hypothetical protein Cgig2_025003 [Carnegiea gigantea]